MEPENQQDNFDLKFSKLEIDLSPPMRGQRSLSSRCITGFKSNRDRLSSPCLKRGRGYVLTYDLYT